MTREETQLFAPPEENWISVSPNYTKQVVISCIITWTIAIAIAVAVPLYFALTWLSAVLGVFFGVIFLWRVFRKPAWVRSWGYAERENDLYIKHGLLYRQLVVIPYGRMQAIEVNSGPLQQLFGLASVQLITATPESSGTIEGLSPEDATALRDRLSARGETQAAGL